MLLRLISPHLLGAWLLLSFFPGELRASDSDDTPIKLCGRDLIRAVIEICGKPRGKRVSSIQLDQVPGDSNVENVELDPEFISSWKKSHLVQMNQDQFIKDERPSGDAFSPIEFLKNIYDKFKKKLKEYIKDKLGRLSSDGYKLAQYLREKRDVSMGFSKYCCEVGCRKKFIAALC